MLMAASVRAPLGRISRGLGAGLMVLTSAALVGLTVYLARAYGDGGDLAWSLITATLFGAAGIVGALLLLRRAAATALVTAGTLGILGHAAFAGGLAPGLSPLWLSQRLTQGLEAAGLAPRGGAPGPVAVTGYSEPSMNFLLGTPTELTTPVGAAQAVAEGRPAVVEGREDAAFRRALVALGHTPRAAGVVEGLDYSDGDDERLTLYRGEPKPIDAPLEEPRP